MMNKKLQALDAIQSLVITAINWTESEFPTPIPGVEEQTIREISQLLHKSKIALDNLMMYEKGLSEGLTVVASEPRIPIIEDEIEVLTKYISDSEKLHRTVIIGD